MSQNYDNWERLVAAVLKRELIWKLCHQESMSTIFSESSSSSLRFSDANSPAPISLGSYAPEFDIKDIIKSVQRLGWGYWGYSETSTSTLADLQLDVQVSDQLYLAAGTKAVTKKLFKRNHIGIAKHEFEQQMVALGNCRHENVGIPWAYYFSETRKFIVYHHYSQGSVFDLLQESKGMKPKWESRLRIAVGAARGVAHIHKQCGGEMAHGNIKSTNIFLNSQGYGLVSDFGLAAGILEKHGPSQESDVYNFGKVLLEIFTRASPMQEADIDHHLRSFKRIVRGLEHQRLLVDELDMWATPFVDEELVVSAKEKEFRRILDIAKRCLASLPGDRPRMAEVVLELEKMEPMLPPSQLLNQDSIKSGYKKRGWNRFGI